MYSLAHYKWRPDLMNRVELEKKVRMMERIMMSLDKRLRLA